MLARPKPQYLTVVPQIVSNIRRVKQPHYSCRTCSKIECFCSRTVEQIGYVSASQCGLDCPLIINANPLN